MPEINKGTIVERWTRPSALPKDAVLVHKHAWSNGKPFGRYSLYWSEKNQRNYHVKMPRRWITVEPRLKEYMVDLGYRYECAGDDGNDLYNDVHILFAADKAEALLLGRCLTGAITKADLATAGDQQKAGWLENYTTGDVLPALDDNEVLLETGSTDGLEKMAIAYEDVTLLSEWIEGRRTDTVYLRETLGLPA